MYSKNYDNISDSLLVTCDATILGKLPSLISKTNVTIILEEDFSKIDILLDTAINNLHNQIYV
jgi:hypothetical protein